MKIAYMDHSTDGCQTFTRIFSSSTFEPYFLTNIIFTQDQTGIDKLEFTAYADSIAFVPGVKNYIKLSYNSNSYIFMIIKVQKDDIKKTQRVTCASPLVLMGWTPVIDNRDVTSQYNSTLSFGMNMLNFWINYFRRDCVTRYHSYLPLTFDITPNVLTTRDRVTYNHKLDEYFTSTLADFVRDAMDENGYLMRRTRSSYSSSKNEYTDYYNFTDIEKAVASDPVVTITDVADLKKCITTKDITKYYTHAVAVYPITDDGAGGGVKIKQARTPNTYGAKYMFAQADKESANISTALTDLVNSVKQTKLATTEIELSEEYNLNVLDTVKIGIPNTAITNQKMVCIKAEYHIDDPLRSKYTLIY